MSSPDCSITLTDEQREFLEECESSFKDRYTDADSEFMQIKESPLDLPPVVDPWYNKPRRNFDWTERRDRGRGGGGYRQHRQQQDYRDHRDHRQDHRDHRQGDRYNQNRYRPY